MQITKDILDRVLGTSVSDTIPALMQQTCDAYGMGSPELVAAFLANVAVESARFKFTEESLNYSKDGLLKTFSKYFNKDTAPIYARQPQKIANRVYANRMGNGDEASGDGWKYRGRGFLQLTGKSTVEQYASDKGVSVDEAIEFLSTPEGACDSAGWYWYTHNLNDLIYDFELIVKKINGGDNGYDERLHYFHGFLDEFNAESANIVQ